MKYNIYINQKAALELGLDLIDAAIINYVVDYCHTNSAVEITLIHGRMFYWINYRYLTEEMPILGINSPEIVRRRFDKICKAGVFEKEVLGNKKTVFAFAEKYESFISDRYKKTNPSA